jgi:hypothetical protein
MKPASLSDLLVAIECVFTLDGLTPVGGDALEVVHRVDPGGFDQGRLALPEGFPVSVPRGD